MTPKPTLTETRQVPGCQTTYQLKGKKQIVFERTYATSARQVFAAFADAERVAEWWGSPGATLHVQSWDVRTGGSWQIIETMPTGKKATLGGQFENVDEPTRIESTLVYGTGAIARKFGVQEVYEFIEEDGKTTLRLTSTYPVGMALKGMLSVGMDQPGKNLDGSRHQWRLDRLQELLQ